MTAPPPAARFSIDMPQQMRDAIAGGGNIAPPISRNEAMQVPAVIRARNLICGSIGKLPLCVQGPDFSEVTDTTYLVNTPPDPEIAQVVTMAMTVEDLLFQGIAWWRVTKWGWHGYPVEARHVPQNAVLVVPTHSVLPSRMWISPDEPFPTPADGGQVYIDGIHIPDDELIRFDSPNPPLLRHAARAIRTCLLLDSAAATYANEPLPLGYFAPKDGEPDPATDDEIEKILDDWETSRRQRAWGYVNAALDAKTLQWNPEQLQLADQRQHAVLEIARATGVDAGYLEAEVSSETYANSEDKRQDLIDFTLDPYLTAIQQRLSMRDCLPRGYNARFDVAGFVRGDTLARMGTYKIGLEVGAYTRREVRKLEHKPPLMPAEEAAAAPAPATPPAPAGAQPPEVQNVGNQDSAIHFGSTDEPTYIRFDGADVAASFQVDIQKRTIVGLAVPWDKVARSGFSKWRFAPDSLRFSDVSRIKLNLDHTNELLGVATRLQSGSKGLVTTFKVGRGPEGDKALTQAEDGILDGLSIEVDFMDEMGDTWQPDPSDETVRLVTQATLRGVALTGSPAFDDARLTSVMASRNQSKGEQDAPEGQGDRDRPERGGRRVRVQFPGVHR